MVLVELGKRINTALRSLATAPVVDEQLLDAVLKGVCAALLESDVNVRLVQNLRKNIKSIVNLNELAAGVNKRKIIQKAIYDELVRLVDPGIEPFKPVKKRANVIMFVGLQGSGKTTTCTKLAYYYQRKGFKTCLVCTDTFRAGAFDQLKQNATKANIPYYGSYTESDPVQLAMDGVEKFKSEGFEVIIVDTSGRHRQETELFQEMKQISDVVTPDNVIFVLDGTIGQAADAHARAFKETVAIGSIVITKMDGHAKGGGAISAVAATGSPIIFIGTGEHIHDLETFKASTFINKMLGFGDLGGLMETVQDLQLDKKDLMKKIEQGEFSLRDMQSQFQTISSMGPMSKLMGMIPGMPQELLGQLSDKDGANKLKRFMCIFDSMTDAELDSDAKCFSQQPSRVYRVAQGSGVLVREIEELLNQYRNMAEMIKTMGGSRSLFKNMANNPSRVNPNQMASQMAKMQSQIAKMVPPGMMEQMGGMGGLQNMMAQLTGGLGGRGAGGFPGGGAGMPDMSMLQNMLGGMGGLGGLGGDALRQGGASRGRGRNRRK